MEVVFTKYCDIQAFVMNSRWMMIITVLSFANFFRFHCKSLHGVRRLCQLLVFKCCCNFSWCFFTVCNTPSEHAKLSNRLKVDRFRTILRCVLAPRTCEQGENEIICNGHCWIQCLLLFIFLQHSRYRKVTLICIYVIYSRWILINVSKKYFFASCFYVEEQLFICPSNWCVFW